MGKIEEGLAWVDACMKLPKPKNDAELIRLTELEGSPVKIGIGPNNETTVFVESEFFDYLRKAGGRKKADEFIARFEDSARALRKVSEKYRMSERHLRSVVQ